MSAQGYEQSLWERIDDNEDKSPKYCPHCGEQLAHPDNLRENDDVDAAGRVSAYREHRATHFDWGVDPALVHEGGDPFLADYYDGVETSDTGPTLDPDEEVAGVYDVEICYEARMTARVVAADDHHAKDRAKDLRVKNEECVGGWVPSAEITHELHDDAREAKRLTRGEIEHSSDIDEDEEDGINWADRLPGWPW